MRDITVMKTAAGSPSAPMSAQCLKHNGERHIRLVGADMRPDPTITQIYDVLRLVPAASAPDYVDTLLRICREERVDVLVPTISVELPLLQRRRAEFEAVGTKVSVSDGPGLEIANDKIRFYRHLAARGFDVPRFAVATSRQEFVDACRAVGYPQTPLCVKLKDGSGSRGVRLIDPAKSRWDIFSREKPNSFYTTYEDMLAILDQAPAFPELLVMELLPGMEYSVDLLADHGKTLYMVGRESNVINASIPQEATLAPNKEAYALSRAVVEDLALDGNVDLDFKFDASGRPRLLEVNPRTAATLSVIAAGGVNLLYLRVKQLLGEPLPELHPNYGVKLKRRYHELFCDKEGKPVVI